MSATISLTGPSTTPGAPEVSPAAINSAVNTALATKLPLAGGTLTGGLIGTTLSLSSTLTASGAITSAGISTIVAGSGSSNHISLGPAASGSTPTITGTGDAGLSIATQNNQPVKFNGPVNMNNGPITLTSNSIFMNNGGAGQILSGSTYTKFINANFNVSGTYSGTTPLMYSFSNSSDTANSDSLTQVSVSHNFGGTNTAGSRTAFMASLWAAAPISGDSSTQQYVAGTHYMHSESNVGGTNLVGGCKGYAYGSNFISHLGAGATNWTLINGLGEINTACQAMEQTFTVAGTITAGDILTLTITSAAVAGSPIVLSHTVVSGETVDKIANTFQNLILTTPALVAAQVSANSKFGGIRQPITVTWQTGTTVTLTTSASGGATATITLGTAPTSGASVRQKFGASFVRGAGDSFHGAGTSGGDNADTGIMFTSQGCNPAAAWDDVIGIRADAILASGSVLRVSNLTGLSSGGRNGVLPTSALTWGIHLGVVNFADQSGFAFLSPGFSVGGTGTVSVGNAALSYAAGGASLDVKGYAGSGNATVVVGGGGGAGVDLNNYYLNDLIYDDLGGQHVVTSVNSGTGAVTGLRTIVQPYSTGSLPTATRATTGGSGLSLTIGITWVASSTLSLNPSAGATTVGGSLTVNGTGTSLTVAHAMSVTGLATLSGGFTGNGVGGVLSGANAFLQVGNGGVRTYSGAASGAQASIMSEEILRGTVASGLQAVNYLWVPDDGAVGPTSSGQIATLQIVHTCTTNAVGNRWGTDISVSNSAAASAGAAAAGGVSFGGIRAQTFPSFNVGGTGVAFATSQGVNFGANITALAQGTATNLRTVTGMEIDVGITAGASSYSKEGLKIVLLSTDAVQGAVVDYGFSIQSQVQQASGVGFKTGIVFGGNGGFGVAATGTLMGAFVGVGGMTAALGIDFSGVTFSETPIKMPIMTNAANDAAAAGAGISVGGFYRNGSVVMQRVV